MQYLLADRSRLITGGGIIPEERGVKVRNAISSDGVGPGPGKGSGRGGMLVLPDPYHCREGRGRRLNPSPYRFSLYTTAHWVRGRDFNRTALLSERSCGRECRAGRDKVPNGRKVR